MTNLWAHHQLTTRAVASTRRRTSLLTAMSCIVACARTTHLVVTSRIETRDSFLFHTKFTSREIVIMYSKVTNASNVLFSASCVY